MLVWGVTGGKGKGLRSIVESAVVDTDLPVIDEVFQPTPGPLNTPHGGKLVNLVVEGDEAKAAVRGMGCPLPGLVCV